MDRVSEKHRTRQRRLPALAVAGLTCLAKSVGTTQAQVDVPTFAGPFEFVVPTLIDDEGSIGLPGPLAATPPGFDLVGTTVGSLPDGYPEIAISQRALGRVQLYRNTNGWASIPASSLQPGFAVDVFLELGLVSAHPDFPTGLEITDIELARFDSPDEFPDLIVAIADRRTNNDVGIVAHFQATSDGQGVFTGFELFDAIQYDLPVTSIEVLDLSQDGRPDIVAACGIGFTPGDPQPAMVYLTENLESSPGQWGLLASAGELSSPAGIFASLAVVTGEMNNIISSPGSGNTKEYLTRGGQFDGLVFGHGTNSGPFSFGVSNESSTTCGFGLGGGEEDSELILFDPFANRRQSIAAATPNSVVLIHNDPRFGTFFHLCDGADVSTDSYLVNPCVAPLCDEASALPPAQLCGQSNIATGNFNGDTFGDLVHVDSISRSASLLLGLGAPNASNKIMQFSNCDPSYFLLCYAPDADCPEDRVIAVDLDLDGLDEVVISRGDVWAVDENTLTFTYRFVVYRNVTDEVPPQ